METAMKTLLCWLALVSPAAAQVMVPGTVTWTMSRPADLTGFRLTVDGGAPVDLGLPPTNTASLSLEQGQTHTLVVSAVYQDGSVLSSVPATVTVNGPATPLQVTDLQPPAGTTGRNNQSFPVSVTATDDSGIKSVVLHWVYQGSDNTGYAVTKVLDTYTAKPLPQSGAGTRTWFFTITANDGEKLNTQTRTAVITN